MTGLFVNSWWPRVNGWDTGIGWMVSSMRFAPVLSTDCDGAARRFGAKRSVDFVGAEARTRRCRAAVRVNPRIDTTHKGVGLLPGHRGGPTCSHEWGPVHGPRTGDSLRSATPVICSSNRPPYLSASTSRPLARHRSWRFTTVMPQAHRSLTALPAVAATAAAVALVSGCSSSGPTPQGHPSINFG